MFSRRMLEYLSNTYVCMLKIYIYIGTYYFFLAIWLVTPLLKESEKKKIKFRIIRIQSNEISLN